MGVSRSKSKSKGKTLPPECGMSNAHFQELSCQAQEKMSAWNLKKHKSAWAGKSRTQIEAESKRLRDELRAISDQLKGAYLSVIMRQIFHIIGVGGKEAWNHISLGTDYDGVINPIDIYPRAEDMTGLKSDLLAHWHKQLNSPNSLNRIYKKYLFGQTPEFYIDRILVLNGFNFMKKYYTDAYLLKGVLPSTGYVLTRSEELLVLD